MCWSSSGARLRRPFLSAGEMWNRLAMGDTGESGEGESQVLGRETRKTAHNYTYASIYNN